MPPTDLVASLNALKQQASANQQMRTQATSAQEFATAQLAQIDDELRTKLGINPEFAEQELADLENKLAATAAELATRLAEERAALSKVLDLARQAQLVR
jgi:hypothetical protein